MKARKKFLLDEIDSKDFNEIKAECESTVKALEVRRFELSTEMGNRGQSDRIVEKPRKKL